MRVSIQRAVALPVITLRISAFRFLVMSTALDFTRSLICLWSTLLFFQIITAWLGFPVFRLFLSMSLIGYALSSHKLLLSKVSTEVQISFPKLTSLSTALTTTGLPATFSSITAAGLFAAALLTSSAAGVWLPSRATTAAVACLCLLFLCHHKCLPFKLSPGSNCGVPVGGN